MITIAVTEEDLTQGLLEEEIAEIEEAIEEEGVLPETTQGIAEKVDIQNLMNVEIQSLGLLII